MAKKVTKSKKAGKAKKAAKGKTAVGKKKAAKAKKGVAKKSAKKPSGAKMAASASTKVVAAKPGLSALASVCRHQTGDRVKVVSGDFLGTFGTGTVVAVSGGTASVDFGILTQDNIPCSDLAPA